MGVSHSFSMDILNHRNYIKSTNIYFLRTKVGAGLIETTTGNGGDIDERFARPGADEDPRRARTATAFGLEGAHVGGPAEFAGMSACRRQNRIG